MANEKQLEFESAMKKHRRSFFYSKIGLLVSILIVVLQLASLMQVNWSSIDYYYIIYFIIAYVAADFINGLVHMWADNSEDYTSVVGPLIAAFQLHHKQSYKVRHPVEIYFTESGMKNWLVPYLAIVVYAQTLQISAAWSFILVSIGLLSSFAEVSHYWSHRPSGAMVRTLQRCHILLNPDHHRVHHATDNKNYAFLNGISNPALNLIARYTCDGYVNKGDMHSSSYMDR